MGWSVYIFIEREREGERDLFLGGYGYGYGILSLHCIPLAILFLDFRLKFEETVKGGRDKYGDRDLRSRRRNK